MPLAFIGSVGGGEMLLIFAVALLLFGARRLPGLARQLGRAVEQFRRAAQEVREEFLSADRELRDEIEESVVDEPMDATGVDSAEQEELETTKPEATLTPGEGQDGGGI
ncbi:MAG: twin-arginine translocase TatA/TatE family subunit [Kiritimatiellae bacterium]|nr:twin-arginine translocase TatA/TatE family subunit [Kiritimatiellia bacterium]